MQGTTTFMIAQPSLRRCTKRSQRLRQLQTERLPTGYRWDRRYSKGKSPAEVMLDRVQGGTGTSPLLHYSKRPDLDVKLGAARAGLPFEPSARIAWILSSVFWDRYPGKIFGDPNVRRGREPCRVIKRSCLDKGDCSIGGAMTVDMRAAAAAVVAVKWLSARAPGGNVRK